MHTLKKTICTATLLICLYAAKAQNELTLQKAFSESYTQEYNRKYSDAISVLSIVYKEDSYELNLRLGWLAYMNKNYTLSQSYYQKAVNLKPYSIEGKLGMIKPLAALESYDKVLSTYEDILKIDGQNYTALYWTGVMMYNRKKYENAIKLFEKLVNMYPFDYDTNHMLAWSYLNQGRNNDAKIIFNKALLIRPGDTSCLEGLSKLK
jgi:tetratricopeptide (TPR) repeat protein